MSKGHHIQTPTHKRLGQPDERQVIMLDPEQFARIEELLLPGYECAKLMLADIQRQQDAAAKRETERREQEQREFEAEEAKRKDREEADRQAAAKKADDEAASFRAEHAAKKAKEDKPAETLETQIAEENAAAIDAIPAEPPTPPPTSPPQPEPAPAPGTPKV